MLDRLNQTIDIGDTVRVVTHSEKTSPNLWTIIQFCEWNTATEAVLENLNTKETKWILLLDLEKANS